MIACIVQARNPFWQVDLASFFDLYLARVSFSPRHIPNGTLNHTDSNAGKVENGTLHFDVLIGHLGYVLLRIHFDIVVALVSNLCSSASLRFREPRRNFHNALGQLDLL